MTIKTCQQNTAQVDFDRLADANFFFNTGMSGRPHKRGLQPHAGPRKHSETNFLLRTRQWPLYVAGAVSAGISIYMLITALLA